MKVQEVIIIIKFILEINGRTLVRTFLKSQGRLLPLKSEVRKYK